MGGWFIGCSDGEVHYCLKEDQFGDNYVGCGRNLSVGGSLLPSCFFLEYFFCEGCLRYVLRKGGIRFNYVWDKHGEKHDDNPGNHNYILGLIGWVFKEKGGFKCWRCWKQFPLGETFRLHLHHIDRDTYNNRCENLLVLCRECHGFLGKERR